jgi:uncharacterized membrane protein YbhN (UPF0104 family)
MPAPGDPPDALPPAVAPKRSLVGRVVRPLAFVVVIGCVVLIVRGLDLRALGLALRGARPQWLVLAAVLSAGRLLGRAVVWRVSLRVQPPIPVLRLFHYVVAAVTASLVTPARAGEALGLWLLYRRHGVPFSQSTGMALGEKMLDAVALLALVLPIPWLVPDLPPWAGRTIGGLAVLGLPALALGWWIGRARAGRGRVATFFAQMRILREPRTLLLAQAACLAAWSLDLAALWASMRAVGLVEGFGVPAFVLMVVNAALVVPSTPGNLGALEAGAILALGIVHVPRPQAAAVALLYHGIQLGPLLVFALFNVRLVFGGPSGERR